MYIPQIREYLPHAYPFLLLDRITAIESGKMIEGYKNLTMNELFFQGHFPQYPIMPGVLIMEALAQISGILGMVTLETIPRNGDTFVFAGLDKSRFKRQVIPGDQLVLHSELLMNKRGLFKFDTKAYVDGNIVAQAEILLSRQTLAL